MNTWLPWSRPTDDDRATLAAIEDALADPDHAADEPDSLRGFCAHLARTMPRADDTFRRRLETRLTASYELKDRTSSITAKGGRPAHAAIIGRQLRFGAAAAIVVTLSIAAAWPVFGQAVPRLTHVFPRAVPSVPGPAPAQYTITPEPLAGQAGFTLLVPTYLPAGCTLRQRSFVAGPQEVDLVYSCVSIAEHLADSAVLREAPTAPAEAIQQVTVSGQPALYIDGAWAAEPGRSNLVWKNGEGQEVIFERDGLVVRVANYRNLLTREELLHVAESLR